MLLDGYTPNTFRDIEQNVFLKHWTESGPFSNLTKDEPCLPKGWPACDHTSVRDGQLSAKRESNAACRRHLVSCATLMFNVIWLQNSSIYFFEIASIMIYGCSILYLQLHWPSVPFLYFLYWLKKASRRHTMSTYICILDGADSYSQLCAMTCARIATAPLAQSGILVLDLCSHSRTEKPPCPWWGMVKGSKPKWSKCHLRHF